MKDLAVVGPGLIGRSITLAYRRLAPDAEIVEIDRGDSIEAARGARLIVLATPVETILHLIRQHAEILRGSVTVDTGSTKRAIMRTARDAGLSRFIGGHPMAGAAMAGPSGARAELFDGRTWFLVPSGAADEALERVSGFVACLGAVPVILADDGREHDRVMAAVSHLPQAVASVLMTVAADAAGERLTWGGSGLKDTTRLAASDAAVWGSILRTNAEQLRPLLLETSSRLSRLAEQLDDSDAVRDLFDRARRARVTLEA